MEQLPVSLDFGLVALKEAAVDGWEHAVSRGCSWLLEAQNGDGGWSDADS